MTKMDPVVCTKGVQPGEATTESKTSDFYHTSHIPSRFDNPYWFRGYGCQQSSGANAFYRTTSSDYGWYPPSIHTVPASFFPTDQSFSTTLLRAGMYRNCSLNTALDKSLICM